MPLHVVGELLQHGFVQHNEFLFPPKRMWPSTCSLMSTASVPPVTRKRKRSVNRQSGLRLKNPKLMLEIGVHGCIWYPSDPGNSDDSADTRKTRLGELHEHRMVLRSVPFYVFLRNRKRSGSWVKRAVSRSVLERDVRYGSKVDTVSYRFSEGRHEKRPFLSFPFPCRSL